MTIADRIRNKRNELQLSQTELAVKAKYYDKTRISKIENSGNDISMKQVKRIALALGVSMEYLMGWNTPEDTKQEQDIRKAYSTNTFALTSDEVELIEAYRLLDENVKEYALNFIIANINKKGQDSELSKAVGDED